MRVRGVASPTYLSSRHKLVQIKGEVYISCLVGSGVQPRAVAALLFSVGMTIQAAFLPFFAILCNAMMCFVMFSRIFALRMEAAIPAVLCLPPLTIGPYYQMLFLQKQGIALWSSTLCNKQ